MAPAQQMTAEEFISAPVPQRGRPWNLVDGEVVMNDPTRRHGHAQAVLFSALRAWTLAEPGRGEVPWPCDVQLDERNVYVPDLVYYREGRAPDMGDLPPYPVPDLAAEVRSPSSWRHDVGRKRAIYEAAGLPELWLVDTQANTVLVCRRSEPRRSIFDIALELTEDQALASPSLPDFTLPVVHIFDPARARGGNA